MGGWQDFPHPFTSALGLTKTGLLLGGKAAGPGRDADHPLTHLAPVLKEKYSCTFMPLFAPSWNIPG